jgi:hypothetical protein
MPYLTFGTYDPISCDTTRKDAIKRDAMLHQIYRRNPNHQPLSVGNEKDHERRKGHENNEKSTVVNESTKAREQDREENATKDSEENKNHTQSSTDTVSNQHADAILHTTRTLDEFYYDALQDTQKRDKNQVVGRYLKENSVQTQRREESFSWRILRVDQLWLWVVDHGRFNSSRRV